MQIKLYKDPIKHRLEFYELVKRMKDIELATFWTEITDREWWFMLESVFPAKMNIIGEISVFMNGEPICDNPEGTLHWACAMVDGRNFRRPAVIELYDPAAYIAEIQFMFPKGYYPGRES